MPRRFESSVKNELYRLGLVKSADFLVKNDLEKIAHYQNTNLNGDTGLCDLRNRKANGGTVIHVDVAATALPVKIPVCCMRSYPGSKVDRTAMGVVAHETGHHVQYLLTAARKFNRYDWHDICKSTKKEVSSYHPNDHERFAETMRVFILNPDLLLHAMPERYKFLRDDLGLVPSEPRRWEVILPKSYHKDARSWIAK